MKYSLQKRTYFILILLIPAIYVTWASVLILVLILLHSLFPFLTIEFSPYFSQATIVFLWMFSLAICVLAINKNQIVINSDEIIIKSLFNTKIIKKNVIKSITVKKLLVKARHNVSISLNDAWSKDYQYQIRISYLQDNNKKEKVFDISKFENKKQLIKDLGAKPIYT